MSEVLRKISPAKDILLNNKICRNVMLDIYLRFRHSGYSKLSLE